MRRALSLCALLSAASCGAPPRGPMAFCQAQAESTPAVKEMTLKSVSNPYFMSQSADLIASTRARAVNDCLKRQGVIAAGDGVERVPQSGGTIFGK